jgi:hypothetical protein
LCEKKTFNSFCYIIDFFFGERLYGYSSHGQCPWLSAVIRRSFNAGELRWINLQRQVNLTLRRSIFRHFSTARRFHPFRQKLSFCEGRSDNNGSANFSLLVFSGKPDHLYFSFTTSILFSVSLYLLPHSHSAVSSSNFRVFPHLHTHPICFALTPATSA